MCNMAVEAAASVEVENLLFLLILLWRTRVAAVAIRFAVAELTAEAVEDGPFPAKSSAADATTWPDTAVGPSDRGLR